MRETIGVGYRRTGPWGAGDAKLPELKLSELRTHNISGG